MSNESELLRAVDDAERGLRGRPGVIGVGLGRRDEPEQGWEICIAVDKERVADDAALVSGIPTELSGLPTKVMNRPDMSMAKGPPPPTASPIVLPDYAKYRPLQGGSMLLVYSSRFFAESWATLGGLVYKGGKAALTNYHAAPAPSDPEYSYTNCYQPNRKPCYCCGFPCFYENYIGPVHVGMGVFNENNDASLITLGEPIVNSIVGIGAMDGSESLTQLDIGLKVQKRGAQTRYTKGVVDGYWRKAEFDDPFDSRKRITMRDIVRIKPEGATAFSMRGDSGSLLLDFDRAVRGLCFGSGEGDDGLRYSWAIPSQRVINDLNITFPIDSGFESTEDAPTASVSIEERLRADLATHAAGREFVDIVDRHGDEVLSLINHNKRVATVWHRQHGPAWIRQILECTNDYTRPTPFEIAGEPVRDRLMRVAEMLSRYGSPALRRDITLYADVLTELPGLSYEQIRQRLTLMDRNAIGSS